MRDGSDLPGRGMSLLVSILREVNISTPRLDPRAELKLLSRIPKLIVLLKGNM
jgi:hypothetical protein